MTWDKTTVPFSFAGCSVLGYAEDTAGAWLVELDRNMSRPFLLYRFRNDRASDMWTLVGCYGSEVGARGAAMREAVTA